MESNTGLLPALGEFAGDSNKQRYNISLEFLIGGSQDQGQDWGEASEALTQGAKFKKVTPKEARGKFKETFSKSKLLQKHA